MKLLFHVIALVVVNVTIFTIKASKESTILTNTNSTNKQMLYVNKAHVNVLLPAVQSTSTTQNVKKDFVNQIKKANTNKIFNPLKMQYAFYQNKNKNAQPIFNK